jgi:hypothetical protein
MDRKKDHEACLRLVDSEGVCIQEWDLTLDTEGLMEGCPDISEIQEEFETYLEDQEDE